MRPSVALVVAGARGNSAVGSRIGAFARELGRRGWEETVIDPASLSATVADRLFSYTGGRRARLRGAKCIPQMCKTRRTSTVLQIHSIISGALSAADRNWCIGDFAINLAAVPTAARPDPTAAEGALERVHVERVVHPGQRTAPATGAVGLRLLT